MAYNLFFFVTYQPNVVLPSDEALEEICSYLQKLQEVDSPLEKLENLLTSIASIFNSVIIDFSLNIK